MLECADARLWSSMIAIACTIPAVIFVISVAWFVRLYFAPPMIFEAAPLGQSELAQVKAAVPPPAAKPFAPPLADARTAYADPAQNILTVESSVMPTKPAALEPSKPITGHILPVLAQTEAPTPQLKQQPTEVAEAVAALPDTKASELPSPPPAMVSPMLGETHSAYADPAQNISTAVSSVMLAKPAALKPHEPINGLIPLPRPKPRVTVALVSRTVSFARSAPVAISQHPTSR